MTKRWRASRIWGVVAVLALTTPSCFASSASLVAYAQQQDVTGVTVKIEEVPIIPGAPHPNPNPQTMIFDIPLQPPAPGAPVVPNQVDPAPVPAPVPVPNVVPPAPAPQVAPESTPSVEAPPESEETSAAPSESTSESASAEPSATDKPENAANQARDTFVSTNPDAFVFTVDTRQSPASSNKYSVTAFGVDDANPQFDVLCDITQHEPHKISIAAAGEVGTCEFSQPGVYTIALKGSFPHLRMGFDGDNPVATPALMRVDQWGSNPWRSMAGMFQHSTNVQFSRFAGTPNTSGVGSMAYMFDGATSFNSDISGWNTTAVTDMTGMFMHAEAFTGDISTWDTSHVTTMAQMFRGAGQFTSDISRWNTAQVTDMSAMFAEASNFDINIRTWDLKANPKLNNIFDYSGISPINYSSTVDGWTRFSNIPAGTEIGAKGVYWCPHPSFDETLKKVKDLGWVLVDEGPAKEFQGPVISVLNKDDLVSNKKDPVTIIITADEPLRSISPEWSPVPGEENAYSRVFTQDETTTIKAWDNYGNPSMAVLTISGFDIEQASESTDTEEFTSLKNATITAFGVLLLLVIVLGSFMVYDHRRLGKDNAKLRLQAMESTS